MAGVALYQLDGELSRAVRSLSGLPDTMFTEVWQAAELRNLLPDVIVAGTDADPGRIARELRGRPEVALLLCSTPTNEPQLRRTLLFTPYLPQDTSVHTTADLAALAAEVASALDRVGRRRGLQQTFAQANAAVFAAPVVKRQHLPYIDPLLEAAPIGIITIDLNGWIVSANPRAAEMLDENELAGSSLASAFGSAAADVEECVAKAGPARKRPARCQVARTGSDGKRAHFDVTGVRYVGEAGDAGVLLILEDVTERVEAAASLRESEWRLQLALVAGRMGTWRWDARTNAVHWSESLEALYGLGPGEFAGTYEAFMSFVHPEDRGHVARKVASAGQDGRNYEVQFRIIRRDGVVRWIADRGQVLFDEAGVRCGITGVCWDETERREAESERERLSAELRHAHALVDALFENAPVGLGLWDRDLRFVRVNGALARMNGVPAPEHAGKTVAELLPGVDPGVMEAFRHVIESGEPVLNLEAHGHTPAHPDEEHHWSVSYYPIKMDDSIVGAGAVCEDITERKRMDAGIAAALERERQARAEAQAAERRAAFLAEAATVLASSLDYECTLTSVARMAVPRIADWCAVDIRTASGDVQRVAVEHTDPDKVRLARELAERFPPDHGDLQMRVLRTGLSELLPDIGEELLQQSARNAEHLNILRELGLRSCICVPMRSRGGILGTLTLIAAESGFVYGPADLRLAEELADRAAAAVENARLYAAAEQRRAEAEQNAEQLRRANAELEQFAFIASHDLQEPLRTVGSYAQLLARSYKGKLGGDADEFIGLILDGVQRMRRLIDDLLNYSRLTREEERPRGRVDLESALAEAVRSLEASIMENQAEISHDPLPELPAANARQMTQLLQNLLSNAIKYRRAEEPPRIHVHAQRQDGMWHLAVEDNGQGFEQKYADRVFGIFKRLHGREVPGTGIGLALCQRIVERHGGRIWAEAEPGRGATFHFTLPAEPPTR